MRLRAVGTREDTTGDGSCRSQCAGQIPELIKWNVMVVSACEQEEDILIHSAGDVVGPERACHVERVEGRCATEDVHGVESDHARDLDRGGAHREAAAEQDSDQHHVTESDRVEDVTSR